MPLEKTPISFQVAKSEDLVNVIYEIWYATVPHLDTMTRITISSEWQKNNIQLMIPVKELDGN